MAGSDIGAVHGIGIDHLMIGGSVTVRVKVTAACRCEVMPGAERSVRHEGKRRYHRQSGREASAQQLGVTNHVRTDSSSIGMILVIQISPVQIESAIRATSARIWWHSVKIPVAQPKTPLKR